jgi:hypothetical protein
VVNDLSLDVEGEYIGSCSDDGTVVINSLFTDEKVLKFEYHRPMRAIALDPGYSRKTSKRFVAGGLAGQLCFNSKKWLGYRDQVWTSMSIVYLVESLVFVIECCCEFICCK